MKSFSKNLSLGLNFKLQILPLMYKINTNNTSFVRSYIVMVWHCIFRFQFSLVMIVWYDCKRLLRFLHTYMIDHYNPSVRIIAQLLTPLMMWALILYVSGGTYSLMSTPNDRFVRNFYMAGLLFTLTVFPKNLLRANHPGNIFFHISF